jgi:hypothetical protein
MNLRRPVLGILSSLRSLASNSEVKTLSAMTLQLQQGGHVAS